MRTVWIKYARPESRYVDMEFPDDFNFEDRYAFGDFVQVNAPVPDVWLEDWELEI